MLGLGQVGWWSQMSVTQFQGHLPESRKVTNNILGKVCVSQWPGLISMNAYILIEVPMH